MSLDFPGAAGWPKGQRRGGHGPPGEWSPGGGGEAGGGPGPREYAGFGVSRGRAPARGFGLSGAAGVDGGGPGRAGAPRPAPGKRRGGAPARPRPKVAPGWRLGRQGAGEEKGGPRGAGAGRVPGLAGIKKRVPPARDGGVATDGPGKGRGQSGGAPPQKARAMGSFQDLSTPASSSF